VLVIGNSHVAALRAAVGPDAPPQGAPRGGLTLDFAAMSGDHLGALAVRNGTLRATTDAARHSLQSLGGKVRFAVADYAAVVLVGGLLAPHAVIELHAAARWSGLPSLGAGLPDGVALISEAAALAALCGAARDRPLFPLLAALQAVVPGRVVVLQQPRLSEAACLPAAGMPRVAAAARAGDGAALSDLYDLAVTAAYGGLARVVLQPAVTRGAPFFTAPDYTRGAVRLAGGAAQPARDVLHGNAACGAAMLDALETVVTAAGPQAATPTGPATR
jgi:hypothetical protein